MSVLVLPAFCLLWIDGGLLLSDGLLSLLLVSVSVVSSVSVSLSVCVSVGFLTLVVDVLLVGD